MLKVFLLIITPITEQDMPRDMPWDTERLSPSPVTVHIFCTLTCSMVFSSYTTNYRLWNWLKQESKLGGAMGERLALERTGLWILETENQYFWAESLLRWVSPAPTQNSLRKSCGEALTGMTLHIGCVPFGISQQRSISSDRCQYRHHSSFPAKKLARGEALRTALSLFQTAFPSENLEKL